MAEEFASKVVTQFTGEIASRLNKTSALATAAETSTRKAFPGHAFETLLGGLATKPINPHAASMCGEAAVDRQCNSEHEAGPRATEPENCCGDLVEPPSRPIGRVDRPPHTALVRMLRGAHSSAALKLMCRQTLAAATK